MVSGTAYVTDTVAHALLANYADYQTVFLVIVAVPSLIGELWFALWLLLRGGKDRPAVRTGLDGHGTSPTAGPDPWPVRAESEHSKPGPVEIDPLRALMRQLGDGR
jgi:Domain of unknown function (DUF4386)